jgi:hypothetical protein
VNNTVSRHDPKAGHLGIAEKTTVVVLPSVLQGRPPDCGPDTGPENDQHHPKQTHPASVHKNTSQTPES